MLPSRFVIQIVGPSCSGKSSVLAALCEKLPETYTISYDKTKWQLSRYHRDKHKPLIKELVLGLFEVVCRAHVPILLDSFIENEVEYARYQQIAEEHGYVFLAGELTAPLDILLARFRERVESVKRTGSKCAVTDEAIFLAQTSKRPFIHEGTPVFDTSVISAASIADQIIGKLSAL